MISCLNQNFCCTNMRNVSYYGYSFVGESFKEYIANKVKVKLLDEDWKQELEDIAVEITGFTTDNFKGIYTNHSNYSNWRIGEAVAEAILEDSGKARFYYDSCRDLKNPNANNTGADLVGFCDINQETLFLFGEVKTSNSPASPPSVLYGRTGMIEQLSDLQTKEEKRNDLVKWLTSKTKVLPMSFQKDLSKALRTYIKSQREKVQLVGVLIRDTTPNELDIKNRAKELQKTATPYMDVWLFAIYSGISMDNEAWKTIVNGGGICGN